MITSVNRTLEGFLQQKAATGRLWKPTILVLVSGFALASQTAAVYYRLGPATEDVINGLILFGAYQVMLAFGLWLAFSFAFFGLSVVLGGSPLMGHLFRVVGWGFGPIVFAGLIWGLGRYVALRDAVVPELQRTGIDHEISAIGSYVGQASGDTVFVGATLLGCIFFGISAYIWSIGIQRAGGLDRQRSVIVAFLPVIAYLVWQSFGVF